MSLNWNYPMELKSLSLKDKGVFDKFLRLSGHSLSVYAFGNIYIWKGLFDIYWKIIEDNLCVFFKDNIGAFLYLPPLGRKKDANLLKNVFRILDGFNKNKDISRIENIEEEDTGFYRGLGYDCRLKSHDYLCSRERLVKLRGNQFKSKRACFNYFIKHYDFKYLPFSSKDAKGCLNLYNIWKGQREEGVNDPVYRGMLSDTLICLKKALKDCRNLGLTGRVVKIDNEIKAFTFGFKLSAETFCVLYEITDLSVKGISQFIFRRFSSELKGYNYINIMDDSGLENLKKVKLSYRPVELIPAYIAKRRNG